MRVQHYGNVSGNAGTQRTVTAMRRLIDEGRADQTVIFAASQIARRYGQKDYRGQIKGLHNFVQSYIHYVKDPNTVELVRSPIWTLYYRTGDCDDQTILLSSLAEAIGFRTRIKAIKADINWPNEFSHVYSQIQLPDTGEWITSDTIVPGKPAGWEADERFGSRTWEGLGSMGLNGFSGLDSTGGIGVGTIGDVGDLGAGFFKDLISNTVDAFKQSVGGAITSAVNKTTAATTPVTAPAKSAGLPSWLLPAGAVAGGLGLLLLVKFRRR